MLVTSITLSYLDHDLYLPVCVFGPHPVNTQIFNEN